MSIIEFYNIAEKEKIDIINYKWYNSKAKIFEINDNYYISINNNKINNTTEEKQVLAEELGHYYCNALYNISTDITIINKCEYRAKKWAYAVLVPLQKLKEYIKNDINNIYELADAFDVDIEYMYNCLKFYKDIGILA